MQLISLPAPRPPHESATDERTIEAVGGMISCIGNRDFQSGALAQLNRWAPVAWWSVYELFDDKPPSLHASAAFDAPDRTRESWQAYREGLYKTDQTFLAAREQSRSVSRLLVHWHAEEFPRRHRESIYSCNGLRERLSIVCTDAHQALLAVNLYRTDGQRPFSDHEIDALGEASALLLSCIQKHVSLCRGGARQDAVLNALTQRERQVCERMLKGMSYDGIAVDLGVSPGTVKTYRDRAFDRLDIHHRNELFALVAGQLP